MDQATPREGRPIKWNWPVNPFELVAVINERGKVYGQLTGSGRANDSWDDEAWDVVKQDLGPKWAHIPRSTIRIQAGQIRKMDKKRRRKRGLVLELTNPKAHKPPVNDSQKEFPF